MSFPRYPKYKESGVDWLGQVPEHWKLVQGRRLFSQEREPSKSTDEQLSATQKYGVVPQKLFMEMEDSKVALALSGIGNFKHVEEGDFVISLRSFQGGIERSKYSGCVSPAYTVLRPVEPINGTFWSFLLKSKSYIEALQTMTDGIRDGKNISYQQFGQIRLPFAPLPEQTRIAEFLDQETAKIDTLVAEQERLMTLLKEKRQAVISHAVTKGLNPQAALKPSGIEWLGDVPAHWETGPLKRFWNVTDCKHVTAEFIEDGIPLASIREVQSWWIDLEKAKCTTEHFYQLLIEGNRQPMPGDLIFSRNATVGEVAQVSPDHPRFAMGQDVVLLRKFSPEYSSDFLQHVIRSPVIIHQLANLMIGSTFKRINVEEIRTFVIPFPPPNEQAKISAFLQTEIGKFDTLAAEAQRAIDLLQERRTALISAAVTGQIDVRQS